jgi:hypothetical protein
MKYCVPQQRPANGGGGALRRAGVTQFFAVEQENRGLDPHIEWIARCGADESCICTDAPPVDGKYHRPLQRTTSEPDVDPQRRMLMNRTAKLLFATAALIGVLSMGFAYATEVQVKLSGDEEVPAVTTSASGSGTIKVNDDKQTKGIEGIAAHIHQAAAGKNGPPVIPLEQTSPGTWSVPEGAKLTDEQYAAFKAGELYVNVHSAAHKPGEIRGQLKP